MATVDDDKGLARDTSLVRVLDDLQHDETIQMQCVKLVRVGLADLVRRGAPWAHLVGGRGRSVRAERRDIVVRVGNVTIEASKPGGRACATVVAVVSGDGGQSQQQQHDSKGRQELCWVWPQHLRPMVLPSRQESDELGLVR